MKSFVRMEGKGGVQSAVLERAGYRETCVTGSTAGEVLRRLKASRMQPMSLFDFSGGPPSSAGALQAVCLRGDSAAKAGFAGSVQAIGISGVPLQPVMIHGRLAGHVYEEPGARVCRLSGVVSEDPEAPRAVQVQSVFEQMDSALSICGFRFTDTVRTWIYLDRLLEWYDEFNQVRTRYFKERGVFEGGVVPASTGIGAANGSGAAVVMDLLAVQPTGSGVRLREVASPLQNPALEYKSSFSRAVEWVRSDSRYLTISGTASIAPDGRTLYAGDAGRQMEKTLDVVHAILLSRGMDWENLFRGIIYFKRAADIPLYRQIAAARGLGGWNPAVAVADICRHDLLFEIEADAVFAGSEQRM